MIVRTHILGCLVAALFLLAGCGGDDTGSSDGSSPSQASSAYDGTFTGTVGESRYEVPVECFLSGSDEEVRVSSDKSDYQDTNGDGMVVSMMQTGEKLIVTIVDGDTTWSAPNFDEWSIEGETITGSGRLFEEGGGNRTRQTSFTVDCGSDPSA